MEVPDPEGYLWVPPAQAKAGASPKGEAGAEEDPREPSLEDLSEAPGDLPPAQASGSRTGSDVDRMSSDVMVQFLLCKLEAVNLFPNSAVREFLKDKLWEARAFARMLKEKEQQQAKESQEMTWLKAENQRLQQELQEAKRSQSTGSHIFSLPKRSKTDFHIQVHVTGKTGGCENEFLKKVSEHLANICLKKKRYQEGCGHFLLVFCPVSSRVGTDMDNALEDLKGEPKAVLVMLHHKPKENTSYVDTKLQAKHPAVVRTVYARYTLDDGFYECPLNEEAVDIVAEVLEDHCNVVKGEPMLSSALSKVRNM